MHCGAFPGSMTLSLNDRISEAGGGAVPFGLSEDFPDFRPGAPWWGGDLQTLRNYIVTRGGHRLSIASERVFLDLRDGSGDRLAGALTRAPGDNPLVVLIHGLSGCESSPNMIRAARHYRTLGYAVLRLNLRGAGPSRSTCRRDYHAGSSRDLAEGLQSLAEQEPALLANGVMLSGESLGGSLIVKFLAEHGREFPIKAAAAISAPLDLAEACRSVMRRRNAPYHRWLLKRMKANCPREGMSASALRALDRVRSLYEFDDLFLAPQFGYSGADDYYEGEKALNYLDRVAVPTLLIHARNDPWVPVKTYLSYDWSANPALTLLLSRSGGHLGFHDGKDSAGWHDRCASRFFAAHR
jgi:predicted alpha/beta-fold hydrolase